MFTKFHGVALSFWFVSSISFAQSLSVILNGKTYPCGSGSTSPGASDLFCQCERIWNPRIGHYYDLRLKALPDLSTITTLRTFQRGDEIEREEACAQALVAHPSCNRQVH